MELRIDKLIKSLNDGMKKRADRGFGKKMNVTYVQMEVLIALADCPNQQLSLKEMEKVLNLAQSTTANLIKRMESKGLLEGYELPEDHRVKMVRLLPKGAQCVEEAKKGRDEAQRELLAGLSEEEVRQLADLLSRMLENL